ACVLFACGLTVSAPPSLSTLSLHDALPIFRLPFGEAIEPPLPSGRLLGFVPGLVELDEVAHSEALFIGGHAGSRGEKLFGTRQRSEEHTSELQSRSDLVCRLLLEKKNQATR